MEQDESIIAPDELDGEEPDDGTEIVRAKWTMDGAETLSEAADALRRFADWLVGLEADGWQLTGAVEDDYGFIRRTGARPPGLLPMDELDDAELAGAVAATVAAAGVTLDELRR